jgi:hypothetical protein
MPGSNTDVPVAPTADRSGPAGPPPPASVIRVESAAVHFAIATLERRHLAGAHVAAEDLLALADRVAAVHERIQGLAATGAGSHVDDRDLIAAARSIHAASQRTVTLQQAVASARKEHAWAR